MTKGENAAGDQVDSDGNTYVTSADAHVLNVPHANHAHKEVQRIMNNAQGLGKAGRKLGGVGVEQIKKKPIGDDERLKDIPASIVFARMNIATAVFLKFVADRVTLPFSILPFSLFLC